MAKQLNSNKIIKLKVVSAKEIENYLKKNRGTGIAKGKSSHYKRVVKSCADIKKGISNQRKANTRNCKGDPIGF